MSISLKKNQSISLKKKDGSDLTMINVGLGWDMAQKKGFFAKFSGGDDIDLDASTISFTKNGEHEIVYYGKLNSLDGAIKHMGDNLTGAGDGDDEVITVDLGNVDPDITDIFIVITSYSGDKFDTVKNVFARIVDTSYHKNDEIVRYNLAESKNNTANIMARLSRTASGWEFTAIGDYDNAKVPSQLVSTTKKYLKH